MQPRAHQILHIAHGGAWRSALASGWYEPPSLAYKGFIHCATEHQLSGVAARYYRSMPDLMLLQIDQSILDAPLVWEDTAGRGERFPHLYGRLKVAAVVVAVAITVGSDATITGWVQPR